MVRTLGTIETKLIGNTFGKLTILEYAGRSEKGDNLWRCQCTCGTIVVGRTSNIDKPNSACTRCKKASGPGAEKRRTFLLGRVFDRLTVLSHAGSDKYDNGLWTCLCSCGSEITTRAAHLLTGVTRSCGCYHRDRASQVHTTHGLTKHPLYAVYWAMIQRCYNPKDPAYKDYGGREKDPIAVCEEWRSSFPIFYDWSIANEYEPGLTIDRENNDLGYTPDNCRWVPMSIQSQNKRNTKMSPEKVEAVRRDSRVHSVIAREYDVDESTISRIKGKATWGNISD